MLKRCILNCCYWGFIYIKNITDFTFHEFYQSGFFSSSLYIFINQSELSSFGFICFFWYTHLKLPLKIGWQILIILLFGIFFRHDLLNFNVSIYFFYSFTRCQIRLNLIGNDMERQRVRDVSQSFLVEFCIDFFMVTMAFMKTVGHTVLENFSTKKVFVSFISIQEWLLVSPFDLIFEVFKYFSSKLKKIINSKAICINFTAIFINFYFSFLWTNSRVSRNE